MDTETLYEVAGDALPEEAVWVRVAGELVPAVGAHVGGSGDIIIEIEENN